MLAAELVRRLGSFELDVGFAAREGTTTALIGESGAGKTTILRLLAGLDKPDRGRITVGGVVYVDTEAGTMVPPWRREIGYVPQDYALFPHLSVYENVAFGLRSLGLPTKTLRPRVDEALRLTGIPELGSRSAAQLSGGQQQRVALARALVLDPRVLLLDEPLSSLDVQARRAVRGELRDMLRRLPCVTVYVTHNRVEALVFGDQIVVLDRGRVSQAGTRDDLLHHPRSPYVAGLMGTNLLVGVLDRGASGTGPRVRTADGVLALHDQTGPDTVFATVSPREITLHREPAAGSAQNTFAGPIVELVPEPPAGERVRIVLGTVPVLVAEVTREAVEALELKEGEGVYASFKATGVRTYGSGGGAKP